MSLLPRSQRLLLLLPSRLTSATCRVPTRGNSSGDPGPKLEHENPFRLPAYHPTNFDKWILVHFRYYPDIKSVPTRVHGGLMEVAKSKARIKLSLVMMLGTVVGCGYMMWYGRKHARNYSLIEHNALRHQKYRSGQPDSSIGHKGLYQDHKDEVETAILKHELLEAKKQLEALEKKE